MIEASKEGVKFSCQGDIGNGSVTIRQHTNVDKPEQNVAISLSEPVALTFSLKYLVNFCKASNLSSSVVLHLSQEVPLLVEYGLGSGHLRFYLAPKVSFIFQCLVIGNRANAGCQHRSVTKSKQTIRGSWRNIGYAKMKLYDNGENGERIVLSLHPRQWGDTKTFTIIHNSAVEVSTSPTFSKHSRPLQSTFKYFKTIETAHG